MSYLYCPTCGKIAGRTQYNLETHRCNPRILRAIDAAGRFDPPYPRTRRRWYGERLAIGFAYLAGEFPDSDS